MAHMCEVPATADQCIEKPGGGSADSPPDRTNPCRNGSRYDRKHRPIRHDGVYSLGGQVLRRGNESDSRFFGKRVTAAGQYALNPFMTLGYYAIYGDVSEKFKPGRDLTYLAGYLTFRF